MTAAAVLYVKDLELMKDFYQRCVGMASEETTEKSFSVLTSGDWELSLVSVPAEVAATITITDPPRRRADVPVKLAFDVASIERTGVIVGQAGGQPNPMQSAWKWRDHLHLDCVDPEGNVVQLRQHVSA